MAESQSEALEALARQVETLARRLDARERPNLADLLGTSPGRMDSFGGWPQGQAGGGPYAMQPLIAADAITANEIAAGTITAAEIGAGSIHVFHFGGGPANLCPNGDFEDVTGNTIGAFIGSTNPLRGWDPAGGNGTFRTRGDNLKTGSVSLESIRSGDTNAKALRALNVPALGGRRIRISAWVRGTAGNNAAATALISIEALKADLSTATTANPCGAPNANVGSSTTWVKITGTGLMSLDTAFIRILVRQESGGGTTDAVRFDTVEVYYADDDVSHVNGNASVVISAGSIVVTNGASVVIIDGSSNMFKIAATGTHTVNIPNKSTGSHTVTLTGLGTWAYTPAHLSFVGQDGATSDPIFIGLYFLHGTRFVAQTSGGAVTDQKSMFNEFGRATVWLNGSDQAVVSLSGANDQTAGDSDYISRYYVLIEAAL